MMKTTINKKQIICFFLLVFLVLLAGNAFIRRTDQPGLETFRLEDGGWGYRIRSNGKILIYQPNIPAYDRVAPFPDEKKARAVGELVLDKIRKKENFSVSKEEVYQILKQ